MSRYFDGQRPYAPQRRLTPQPSELTIQNCEFHDVQETLIERGVRSIAHRSRRKDSPEDAAVSCSSLSCWRTRKRVFREVSAPLFRTTRGAISTRVLHPSLQQITIRENSRVLSTLTGLAEKIRATNPASIPSLKVGMSSALAQALAYALAKKEFPSQYFSSSFQRQDKMSRSSEVSDQEVYFLGQSAQGMFCSEGKRDVNI